MSSTSSPRPLPPDISRGSDMLLVAWLTVSMASLLVSSRFYVRGVIRKNLGWDDYTILLALAFAMAQSIVAIFLVKNGFGRNIFYLTSMQVQHWGLYTDICMMLFTIGTGLTRISVCLFVLRLVPATKVFYRRWIWGLLALFTIISLADFLAQCFQCVPLPGLWDKSVKARCFPESHMTRIAKVQGGSAVITDLLCVLLPVLVLWNVQISLRDKAAILVIVGLGIVTAAAACVRTTLVDFQSENPTWDLIPTAMSACLEQNIGITVASMPALRQLLLMRKQPYPSRSTEPRSNHQNNTTDPRSPFNHFPKLSASDHIRLPDHNPSPEPNGHELSKLPPKETDIEKGHEVSDDDDDDDDDDDATRASLSLVRMSMVSPPLWIDRKLSSASKVEMSRVASSATFVHRKPSSSSSAEPVGLGIVSPSWGSHRKPSYPTDRTYNPGNGNNNNNHNNSGNTKRPSTVSPSSVDAPPSPFSSAARPPPPFAGKFEETGLRLSRIASPEEVMMMGNPAALGYSCTIQGGTPPKASPKAYALA